MALNANNAETAAGKAIDPIDAGTYVARLIRVIDLGVQKNAFDEEKKANEIFVVFELMDEYLDGEADKPRVLSTFVKLYRGATKGRNVDYLAGLDPNNEFGGDWAALCQANAPCLLNVSKKPKAQGGGFKNNIESISPMMKGLKTRDVMLDSFVFDLDAPDREVWEKLPEWVQERISQRITDGTPTPYERTEREATQQQARASNTGESSGAAATTGDDNDTPW